MLLPMSLRSARIPRAVVLAAFTLALLASPAAAANPPAPPPGPPFPSPVNGQAVYDFAGILSPAERERAEAVINNIKTRTAAEVVVYTQDSGTYPSTEQTEAKARALIDQWGVGRKGFNDGLAIFFDMQPNLEHGQVQLYAAPGFESAYLANDERQSIFENDMLPLLKEGDFDGALDAALTKVDAAAAPEHAAQLQTSRQFNAVLGLVGAPIVFMGLVGWVFFAWRRYGKDPVYLDDPSVLMPAPPPDLTAASGAMVMDGRTSRRALTTAMLDLASRGEIAFRQEQTGLLHHTTKVGIDLAPGGGDDVVEAQRRLNARRPTGPAEAVALEGLTAVAEGHLLPAEDLPKFGTHVPLFDRALEDHVVAKGWFANKPSSMTKRWVGSGTIAIVAGGGLWFLGANVPMSGLVLIGVAAIAGGIVIVAFSRFMPAVTMSGAMIRAMLAAYRRTLEKTMAQARSMQQVVEQARLPWLETPDQAVVWGTALGLQAQIEDVLKRSLDDVRAGTAAATPYFPFWYQSSNGASFMSAAGGGGSGGSLFSDSAMPDIGGMMSSLGTIGNSPSSNGGGGFGGGGSGGGGGGAGGGF
jgi:uncharacterized membrane protein YgcG